jgi:hypothetical protein
VHAAVREPQPAAGDDVAHGRGHEDLTRTREARQPCGDVHRHPAEPAVIELALARVDAGADLEAEVGDLVVERACERHRVAGDAEGRQEAVPCRIDLATAEPRQPIPEPCVVGPKHLRPGPVTELAHPAGRVDDVREQERREDAMSEGLEVLGPPSVPIHMFHRGTAPSSFDRACASTMRAWCVHSGPRSLPTSMGWVSLGCA